ncbi:ABC transporter permease [Mesorhizobium muleiense]|uniref:ABC transporter permease n=1 Tax=Mesorhizobium muleiense TaxID=1004279 RepID=UPI001F1F8E20|nr:ABC transporter permease [Mesorhizobium muleiense]MCF6112147.1 ABC transporter permease [Mesorhizobium muleiense]
MTTTASTSRATSTPLLNGWLTRIGGQNISLLIALAVLVAIFGFLRPDVFFSARNIINIGLAVTILGILAMAQTVVIVSGGLDISVGSIVGLSTMVLAVVIQETGSVSFGVVAGLVSGLIAGLVNGSVIVYGPVNAVIATLGTMSAFRGLAYLLNNGNSIAIQGDGLRLLGIGGFLGLPYAIWLLLVIVGIFIVFTQKTVIGRNIYAIGGNQTVARLAGLPIKKYQLGIYAMSGVAAAVAGLILASRTMSGQPASGSQGLELEAITAAILGGSALQGGKGTVVGAMLGVLIIGVLNNGMILTSVPTFYQLLAKGALLILAVIVQERQRARSGE